MNQKLEQYLQFFIDHWQKNQSEWLAYVEFTVNSKVYLTTKISPFMENYERELRIGANIRKKEKVTEFVERIQKQVGAVLKKAQEEMKRQIIKENK